MNHVHISSRLIAETRIPTTSLDGMTNAASLQVSMKI